MRNIIGEEDIFVKYLKPEMDIVEFESDVFTSMMCEPSDHIGNNDAITNPNDGVTPAN